MPRLLTCKHITCRIQFSPSQVVDLGVVEAGSSTSATLQLQNQSHLTCATHLFAAEPLRLSTTSMVLNPMSRIRDSGYDVQAVPLFSVLGLWSRAATLMGCNRACNQAYEAHHSHAEAD